MVVALWVGRVILQVPHPIRSIVSHFFSNSLTVLPLIWIGYGVLNQSDIGEWLSLVFEIPYFVAAGDGMERVFDAAACDGLSRRGAGIRGLSLRGGSLCGWLEMVSSAWWDENRL